GSCSIQGVELPHPFVYLWEDVTPDKLAGLVEFVDSLLSATFDFVLCICNTGFDSGRLSRRREDPPSAEHSSLYFPFEKIDFSGAEEVLRAMGTCFARRLASASEHMASSSHENVPRSALRTFVGRTTNSEDDFLFIAKDGISIATTKDAACNSFSLRYLIRVLGDASESFERVDARLLLLVVQWLEYSNGSFSGCVSDGDPYTGALNVCSCCKPNAYQARLLDHNQPWWWNLVTASPTPRLMSEALAGRIANVAPPSRLKDIYSNSRGPGRSTASWSTVAPSFATMSMPSTLADEELLNIVRSYSSRYPSLHWVEEFASISRQWKRVIDTHRHLLPRLFVDAVKVRGCQLEIRLLA
ncbi:hypothetical protein AAVH_43745, partial [Aphelenchoides avenae]